MIDPKDRGQLLRMAGNIACGFADKVPEDILSELSARIAIETLKEVDRLIAKENKE